MKQVINWKKITKRLRECDLYYFKANQDKHDLPWIVTGRLTYWIGGDEGYFVIVVLDNVDVRIELSKFTHYAKVTRAK